MKEILLKYLEGQVEQLSLEAILLNFLISIGIGMVIYLSYRFSHAGTVYSAKFNVTLVMLCVITTMIMTVIGNNIALSLGMVGALSIVRFRTAIKDPRDTCYIFWCIAVGICCGVSQYVIAGIGSATVFLFLLLMGSIKNNDRFLLIIHGEKKADSDIEKTILTLYKGQAKMRVKNTTPKQTEYIYELSEKMVDKVKNRNIVITDVLYEIEGVESINLICQNEEISR